MSNFRSIRLSFRWSIFTKLSLWCLDQFGYLNSNPAKVRSSNYDANKAVTLEAKIPKFTNPRKHTHNVTFFFFFFFHIGYAFTLFKYIWLQKPFTIWDLWVWLTIKNKYCSYPINNQVYITKFFFFDRSITKYC